MFGKQCVEWTLKQDLNMLVKCPHCNDEFSVRIPYKNDLCGDMKLYCEDDEGNGCGQRMLIEYRYVPRVTVSQIITKDKTYG